MKDDDFELWFYLNGEFVLEIWREQRVSVKILGWRLKMKKIQFGPSICENYSLVPQTLENYKLVPGAYSEILNRITYELLYSYEILKLSIWSSNLTKITI